VTNTLDFAMKAATIPSISVTPNNASPVLKTNLTIALPPNFPVALQREDFTVNMTSSTNSSIVKYLRVVEVNDTAKSMIALFGGAPSGSYILNIRHGGPN
jgi:hypothetical protein